MHGMRRRQNGQNLHTTPQPNRTRTRLHQPVIFTSSSDSDDSIPQISIVKATSSDKTNGFIDEPLSSTDSSEEYSSYDGQSIRAVNSDWSPHKQQNSSISPKKPEETETVRSNKPEPLLVIPEKRNESLENPDIDSQEKENSGSDIYHLNDQENPTPKRKKVIKRRRVIKEPLPNAEKEEKPESSPVLPQPEQETNSEVKTRHSFHIINTPSTPPPKNPRKTKRRDRTNQIETRPTTEAIPNIYSISDNVLIYTITRTKRMMGIKTATFSLLKDGELIYHTKLQDVGTKMAYVINSEMRIDRFSKTFIGYLLKQERSTRFTLMMPLRKKDEQREKEVLGFYFYHHEDKTRHAYVIEPPSLQPYFPATKEMTLSRLAKSMTVPENFVAYTACSYNSPDSIQSVKNMSLTQVGNDIPIVGVYKIAKNTYQLRMYNKYPTIFGFSFALASIITKPSLFVSA